ncbi:DUF2225 domain-containing protein [Caminicella sporogenes]|uniref:DUF2225 domain-containing protein n=1 Tax=Caminicella sporogenes TaxID=166485 RepID=UPI00253FDB3A|nr:DUF2225 domain-containing protein [Caminicella sporogenes]WIF94970.1 DUF2225 domain-containing protein [Caminicella sporogenes]
MNKQLLDHFYDREIECPICKMKFTTKKVRTSAIRVIKRDEDFCPYYKSENPLFYNVFVCPNCGYAALESTFSKINELEKEKIVKFITSRWKQRSYGKERNLEEAIQVYKLALICYQVSKSKYINIGKVCLRLAWFYRYMNDEREKEFLKFTIDAFQNVYTKERLDKEEYSEVVILYLLGELNRRVGNYKEAIKWFDKALSNPDIKKKRHIEIRAREQWRLAREEYNNK